MLVAKHTISFYTAMSTAGHRFYAPIKDYKSSMYSRGIFEEKIERAIEEHIGTSKTVPYFVQSQGLSFRNIAKQIKRSSSTIYKYYI